MGNKGRWDHCDSDFLRGIEIADETPGDKTVLAFDETQQRYTHVPQGGASPHALGGAMHTESTLAELNALLSDANLDAAGTARPPAVHSSAAHSEVYVLGSTRLTVGAVAPTDPQVGDLWVDTSGS